MGARSTVRHTVILMHKECTTMMDFAGGERGLHLAHQCILDDLVHVLCHGMHSIGCISPASNNRLWQFIA